jgi:hypothetical protein
MDAKQIADAARQVALDLGCIGTDEQDRIATAFEKFADLIERADCSHDSLSGDEGPIADLGRFPTRWKCDACGAVTHDATTSTSDNSDGG